MREFVPIPRLRLKRWSVTPCKHGDEHSGNKWNTQGCYKSCACARRSLRRLRSLPQTDDCIHRAPSPLAAHESWRILIKLSLTFWPRGFRRRSVVPLLQQPVFFLFKIHPPQRPVLYCALPDLILPQLVPIQTLLAKRSFSPRRGSCVFPSLEALLGWRWTSQCGAKAHPSLFIPTEQPKKNILALTRGPEGRRSLAQVLGGGQSSAFILNYQRWSGSFGATSAYRIIFLDLPQTEWKWPRGSVMWSGRTVTYILRRGTCRVSCVWGRGDAKLSSPHTSDHTLRSA